LAIKSPDAQHTTSHRSVRTCGHRRTARRKPSCHVPHERGTPKGYRHRRRVTSICRPHSVWSCYPCHGRPAGPPGRITV